MIALLVAAIKIFTHLFSQPCFVSLPELSVCLPCLPTCLVSLLAVSTGLPCQPTCLVSLLPCHFTSFVSPPALSACLPCQPTGLSFYQLCQPACLVSPPALSARLPCQPACLVSPSALFLCTTNILVLLNWFFFFCKMALSNLLLLDIYGCNEYS
jgi:hypothetical protein